jgi:hypothetical protein
LSIYLGIFSFCYAGVFALVGDSPKIATLVDNIFVAFNPSHASALLKAITFFGKEKPTPF